MSRIMMPVDNFFRSARRWPKRIAVEILKNDRVQTICYGDLAQTVNALAAALQAIDPEPQSRVGICAYNNYEHLVAWLATYAAGKVWVPLNPRNGIEELDRIIALTEPSIIFVEGNCLDKFGAADAALIGTKKTGSTARLEVWIADIIEQHKGKEPKRHKLAGDDLQAIKFTGGSSGIPKGVMQTYRVFNCCIATMLVSYEFSGQDRHLIAAPMTHGANTIILPIFAVGGTQLFIDQTSPSNILSAIEKLRVTTMFVPPTIIYMMLEDETIRKRDLSSLRHFIVGGASIRPDVVAKAMPIFNHAMEACFGQTEVPQIAICMRARDWQEPDNYASTGQPTFLTQVGIMDKDGALVPAGVEGELVFAGDLVMKGYYKMPEKTRETIIDGWLHTGDIAYMDERGFVFIKDRIRDVVVTGGFNVYPNDVEAALGQHPDISECVVFGLPDQKWGEAVHAAVELSGEKRVSEAELIDFVKTRLGSIKTPKRIHITDQLPRSPVGKVLRREAKTQFKDS